MKTHLRLASIGSTAALLIAGGSSALADEGQLLADDETHLVSSEDYVDRLEELVGTQSPEDIEAVENTPGAVQILVDPETGETLAAISESTCSLVLSMTRPWLFSR